MAEKEAKEKEESVPREHKSALKKAKMYAETEYVKGRHLRSVDFGIREKFTTEEAQYARDNLK